MLTFLALIISGGIGGLLLWLVGLICAFAIIYAILRAVQAPPWFNTVLYVIGLVVLLVLVISFFFGDSGGTVIVR